MTTKYRLDPDNPPRLSRAEAARLDALMEAEINAAAEADPDNPPLTPEELRRISFARRLQAIRARLGLSQERFAARYRLPIGTVRDLEQGRTSPDRGTRNYIILIEKEPVLVAKAIGDEAA
jgi:putative transcriptional regulator